MTPSSGETVLVTGPLPAFRARVRYRWGACPEHSGCSLWNCNVLRDNGEVLEGVLFCETVLTKLNS